MATGTGATDDEQQEEGTMLTEIEGYTLTLFADDAHLADLTDDGTITWLRARTEMFYLEPWRRLFDPTALAHNELTSHGTDEPPRRSFDSQALGVLLNGIANLGGFIAPDGTTEERFHAFASAYLSAWPAERLWRMRLAIVDGTRIQGFHDYHLDADWTDNDGRLTVNPERLWRAVEAGALALLNDPARRASILRRVALLYL